MGFFDFLGSLAVEGGDVLKKGEERARQKDEQTRAQRIQDELLQLQREEAGRSEKRLGMEESAVAQRSLQDQMNRFLSAAAATGTGQELPPELMQQFPGLRQQVDAAAQMRSREMGLEEQDRFNQQIDRGVRADDAAGEREYQGLQNQLMGMQINDMQKPTGLVAELGQMGIPQGIIQSMLRDPNLVATYQVYREADPTGALSMQWLAGELKRRMNPSPVELPLNRSGKVPPEGFAPGSFMRVPPQRTPQITQQGGSGMGAPGMASRGQGTIGDTLMKIIRSLPQQDPNQSIPGLR